MTERHGSERQVLVTGGTGALGRAVVGRFLDGGDRVVVPWVDKREQEEVRGLFATALADRRLVLVECDVASEDGALAAAGLVPEIEVLVNGVGGFGGGSAVYETDLELWDHMFRINVRTAVAASRAVVPAMLARGRGSIVNVASRAATDCPAGLAAYSASKAAVGVLTRTLQAEVADAGLRVNAVVPTTIDTPTNRQAMPDADFSAWTPPARIAEVIAWLSSDAAAAVRGGLIPV